MGSTRALCWQGFLCEALGFAEAEVILGTERIAWLLGSRAAFGGGGKELMREASRSRRAWRPVFSVRSCWA